METPLEPLVLITSGVSHSILRLHGNRSSANHPATPPPPPRIIPLRRITRAYLLYPEQTLFFFDGISALSLPGLGSARDHYLVTNQFFFAFGTLSYNPFAFTDNPGAHALSAISSQPRSALSKLLILLTEGGAFLNLDHALPLTGEDFSFGSDKISSCPTHPPFRVLLL